MKQIVERIIRDKFQCRVVEVELPLSPELEGQGPFAVIGWPLSVP